MPRMINLEVFRDWSLSQQDVGWIMAHCPTRGSILELGFGAASIQFCYAGFKVQSVEHDMSWVGRMTDVFGDSYLPDMIHAPVEGNWYRPSILKNDIRPYDLLIIDGPDTAQRYNIIRHLELFDLSKPIYIHDVGFDSTDSLVRDLLEKTGRRGELIESNNKSAIGIAGANQKWKS